VTLHREETEKAQDLGSSLPDRIRKAGSGRKKTDPTRAGVVVGAGGIGRADNAGRSGKPPALDLPQHPAVGGRAGGPGLPGQPPDGRVFAGRPGVHIWSAPRCKREPDVRQKKKLRPYIRHRVEGPLPTLVP
jgi:hypothetical protein